MRFLIIFKYLYLTSFELSMSANALTLMLDHICITSSQENDFLVLFHANTLTCLESTSTFLEIACAIRVKFSEKVCHCVSLMHYDTPIANHESGFNADAL